MSAYLTALLPLAIGTSPELSAPLSDYASRTCCIELVGNDLRIDPTATAAGFQGAASLNSVSPSQSTLASAPIVELSSGIEEGMTTGLGVDSAASVEGSTRYSSRQFWKEAKSIPWRFGGAAAAITVTGLANWNWGSSSFRFESEGWFGKDTASLGMDKLGHAYSSYVLTEFFADGIANGTGNPRAGAYTASLLAMGLMTYIEVFDGFSADHGFSHEDLAVDAAGALLSVARRSIPGLREKLDFRLLYIPSKSTWRALNCLPAPHCDEDGATVRSPITDYSGQRYLLAFKLAGIENLKQTPLRLVELHAGYYARGFTKEEEDRGDPLRRRIFFGAGLNISELLFPTRPRSAFRRGVRSALEYLQVPYTAIHSN